MDTQRFRPMVEGAIKRAVDAEGGDEESHQLLFDRAWGHIEQILDPQKDREPNLRWYGWLRALEVGDGSLNQMAIRVNAQQQRQKMYDRTLKEMAAIIAAARAEVQKHQREQAEAATLKERRHIAASKQKYTEGGNVTADAMANALALAGLALSDELGAT